MDRYAELPTDLLLPPAVPMRTARDPQKFAELVADVRANGIRQPVIVTQEGDHYRVVAGETRWLAAQEAGLATVPCMVRDYTALQAALTTAAENLQREDVPPLDEGRYFAYLQDTHGLTEEEIAQLIHKSAAYVHTRLRTLRLPADVQEALRASRVSLTVALELGKVVADGDRTWLLHHASSGGATAEVVRGWVADVNVRAKLAAAGQPAPTVDHQAPPATVLEGICEWHRHKVPLDKLVKLAVCADAYGWLLDLRDELARQEAAPAAPGGGGGDGPGPGPRP